ncbi:MAG TPA: phosphopantothenoylcysteine decarboxylase [Phycisphaerae bacterium]|nr:phosphopantothenoylcysteine decarboxylase [Phycisphaerae bacterium]
MRRAMHPETLRILITAGPTREYIDPVRYISNDSSGKMGFALAQAARSRGHRVTLVHGPVALPAPSRVQAVPVVSAADMLRACLDCWAEHDALIMAAAVADYTPARPVRAKLKKSASARVLRLKPTVDILAMLAKCRRPDQIVVGFAVEDRAPRRNAEQKLRRKGLDAIVLNRLQAIGAERAAVEILVRAGAWQAVRLTTKSRLAARLIRLVERLHNDTSRLGDRSSGSGC